MELKEEQFAVLKEQFKTLKDRSRLREEFEGIDLSDVQTQADFEALPFSEKGGPARCVSAGTRRCS